MTTVELLEEAWDLLVNVESMLKRMECWWRYHTTKPYVTSQLAALTSARRLVKDVLVEESEKTSSAPCRVGFIKSALDMLDGVEYFLHQVKDNWWIYPPLSCVETEAVNLHRTKLLLKKVLEQEVAYIKILCALQKSHKEQLRKEEEFHRLNLKWVKIQFKFRCMEHPDWMPNPPTPKKKKNTVLGFLTQCWRKYWSKKSRGSSKGDTVILIIRTMGGKKSKVENRDISEQHYEERVARIRDYIEKIARNIGPSEDEEIELFLKHPEVVDLLAGKVYSDPNVLHIALSMLAFDTDSENKLFEYLVKTCADMVLKGQRRGHYQGQTPLHMAICHDQEKLVICLLDEIAERLKRSSNENLREVFHCAATGDAFRKAVMRSELPLSVAASVGNKNIFDALVRHGAELDRENSKGNNVYHCLIEYAYLYPDKLNSVMDMFRHIHEESKAVTQVCEESVVQVHEGTKTKNVRCKILFMRNKEGDNPLQAAIRYGQPQIFEYILEKAYLYSDYNSGLFDMKVYDVTDLDQSLLLKFGQKGTQMIDNSRRAGGGEAHLDFLFTMKTSIAFRFIEMQVIQRLITAKWKFYRKLVYPLWLIHTLFMGFLTWCATKRAQVYQTSDNMTKSYNFPLVKDDVDTDTINDYSFVTFYSFITLVFALIYILQEAIRLFKGRLQCSRGNFLNPYASNVFRIAFLLFAICLTVDFFAMWDPSYKDYLLIIALIVGWFLFLFFARAVSLFCNFTSLILTVLPTDVFRFAFIIFIVVVAFATAFFVTLQETNDLPEIFQSWWRIVFISFQSIFGFDNIPLLKTENAVFLCILYAIFMIMTTVLMVNSLIAIISNTCDHLFTAGDISVQLRLNEYSIIRFLESVLPDSFVQKRARDAFKTEKKYRYDVNSEELVKVDRYLVELKSLKHLDGPDQVETERVDFIHRLNMAFTPYKLPKTKNKDNISSTGKGMMGSLRKVDTPPRVATQKPEPEAKYASASDVPLQINHIIMGVCNDCANKV